MKTKIKFQNHYIDLQSVLSIEKTNLKICFELLNKTKIELIPENKIYHFGSFREVETSNSPWNHHNYYVTNVLSIQNRVAELQYKEDETDVLSSQMGNLVRIKLDGKIRIVTKAAFYNLIEEITKECEELQIQENQSFESKCNEIIEFWQTIPNNIAEYQNF